MDIVRVKKDLEVILPDYQRKLQKQGRPAWKRHTWRVNTDGSFEVLLEGYPLPPNARPDRVSLRIEGRKCLYDPAGPGQYHFFRNVWLSKPVEVLIPGTRQYGPLPRLHSQDPTEWYYLCVHPGTVDAEGNIVNFLRILELFVSNADPRVW